MTLSPHEPRSAQDVAVWVRERTAAVDEFREVYDASQAHRIEHGGDCTVYPSSVGPLLGTLARISGAQRLLEIGCGLGYGALCMARGSGDLATVDTIERDDGHAALARANFERHGVSHRVQILAGDALEVLATLTMPYGFMFIDSDPDEYAASFDHLIRLLAPDGLLVTSNLFLAQYAPDIPGLEEAAQYRERISSDPQLRTVFLPSGLALTVRR